MGFRKFLLLGFVVFGFGACKKQDPSLGVDLLPDGDVMEASFNNGTSIKAWSLLDEPAVSTTSAAILGTAYDPVFGKTASSVYAQIFPVDLISDEVFASTFNAATVDSMVLSLVYSDIGGSIYGNEQKTAAAQLVKVYRVTESMTLATDSSFKSDRVFTYDNSQTIAEGWIYPNFTDSVKVDLGNRPAQIRIKFKQDFANSIRDAASTSGGMKLKDADTFLEFFKGLYIVAENPAGTPNSGGFYYFDLSSFYSGITMYYHDANGRNNLFFKIPERESVNHFSHDVAALQLISDSVSLNKQTCFLQAMHSMKTRLFFPGLQALAKNKTIAIVDAKLIISPKSGSYETFRRPNRITALMVDAAGELIATKDAYEISDPSQYSADLNSDGQYVLSVTRYMQGLVKSGSVDYGFDLLRPGGAIYGERLIFNGPESTENPLQLKIKYIELNN